MAFIDRVLTQSIAGGIERCEENERRLTIVNPSHAGCAGLFILFWVSGWTFGMVLMAREVFAKPNPRDLAVWGVMAGIDLAMICFLLWCFFGREELRVEGGAVEYSRYAIVRLRRKRLSVLDVKEVELVSLPQRDGPNAIEIRGRLGCIRFGKGLIDSVLVRVGRKIRERFEHAGNKALSPSPRLDDVEAAEGMNRQRAQPEALAAVRVPSAEAAWADQKHGEALTSKIANLSATEARPREPKRESAVLKGFKKAVSWALLIYCVGLLTICNVGFLATIPQLVRSGRWGTLFILVGFWVVAVGFAFVDYVRGRWWRYLILAGFGAMTGGFAFLGYKIINATVKEFWKWLK